jgi:cell division protein FtsB
MKEFQEKNKQRRKRRSKVVLFIMLVVLVLLIRGSIGSYQKERNSRLEVNREMKEKEALAKRYEIIREQSDSLKNRIGIETEIRNKFDVAKEGEGVIVIVEKDVQVIEEDKRGVLKRFWDSVRGAFTPEE